MKRKFITFALAFVMVVSAFSPALAAYYKDTANTWAENDVNWATEQGFLKGDGNGYFRPKDPVSRAEFVTGINRLLKVSAQADIRFPDVNKANWYYSELAKGVYAGIIDDSSYNFRPNEAITREDASLIVQRAYRLKDYPAGATVFKDSDSIRRKGAIGALVAKKVLNGYDDGYFYPQNNLTRAQFSKILRAAVANMGLPEIRTEAPKYTYYPKYQYYPYGGYYYCCNEELSALLSAVETGNAKLKDKDKYTEASVEKLDEAVSKGKVVYNKYKDTSCTYYNNYYYDYNWANRNFANWTEFYNYMSRYTNYTKAQIESIWNNGYYGYDYWYGYNFSDFDAFRDYMNKYYSYTYDQLYDMYYYGYRGYYGYYDYCPYSTEINNAKNAILKAISGLEEKQDTPAVTVESITVK
ncbi:MAG: S-layer homology domain-containing protein, partial [Tissierellia bacterium]|nr:S-layer homology domain-containing protein [Tissierellia bacterium]